MLKYLSIFIILILPAFAPAQDPHFSQFYANPVFLAPSFAGSSQALRLVLNTRDQWSAIPGNYITSSFSADYFFDKFNSGMALYAINDNAGRGKLTTTRVGYAYSYLVKMSPNFIFQPGLSAYYQNRSIDVSMLSFADEFFGGQFIGSSSEVLPPTKSHIADFSISVLSYLQNWWFGSNVDHLMNISPVLRNDYRYVNMRVTVFGGYKHSIFKRVRDKTDEFIHAAFKYQYQSKIHQIDIGAYYNRNPFILGIWYRGIPAINLYPTADALVFLGGIKYNDFIFSYSFDMSLGKLISRSGGSHEISIIYVHNQSLKVKPRKFKPIPCPEL